MTDEVEVFLSEEAAEDRTNLDATQDEKLLWLAERLKADVTYRDQVPRDRIPGKIERDYGCTNLWRLQLPGGWRALYTILTRANEPTTVSILRILDHGAYDRLFGYSTS